MAYNVLKGNVDGSVDQHADQEIDGVKVFKNTISASVFYDTDAQSPCATMRDVALTSIKGKSKNSIIVFDEDTSARTHHNFTYNGEELSVKRLRAEIIAGSAIGLTEIPTDKFADKILAKDLNIGHGLHDVRGKLQIKDGEGLALDEDGLSLSVAPMGALHLKDGRLSVDPTKSPAIATEGQNLSDADTLIVYDESRARTCATTLSNFYDNYINVKIPHSSGDLGAVQLKSRNGFSSSSKLSFDSNKSSLNVEGSIVSLSTQINEKIVCNGAVHHSIKKISDKNYDVGPTDYTILCDTKKNSITVVLPPACDSRGRVLVVKKTNADKYKLNSNEVKVMVKEGVIDLNDTTNIKMNYSSRTFQSDGENWWVVGAKGT